MLLYNILGDDILYTYELHSHTSEVSGCANVKAVDSVRLHKEAGYAGMVITNHFCQYGENAEEAKAKIDRFIDGYCLAQNAADGITVLFGMELRFRGSMNDYLIFGITPDFLRAHPEIIRLDQPAFFKLAEDNGLLIVQAHPFRSMCTPSDTEYIHGVEVYNGNPRHNSNNETAELFCAEHNLIPTSGSDFHQIEDIGIGGIITEEEIKDEKQLVEVLRNRRYTLKTL